MSVDHDRESALSVAGLGFTARDLLIRRLVTMQDFERFGQRHDLDVVWDGCPGTVGPGGPRVSG